MTNLKFWINYNAFVAIFRQEIRRWFRIWIQTLFPPIITSTLYFIIFGNLIGRQISKIDDFTYMEFITPGLIMLSVITNSYSNVVSSFYSKRFQKSIEELLVSPVSNIVILMGFISGGISRSIVTGSLVFMVSFIFIKTTILHPFLMVMVIILTAMLFSFIGFINAMVARNFDDVSIIPTFILTPLTYLGGVFYSISLLPEFWQSVSKLNPILYIINALRYSMLGISDINVYFSLFILVIANIMIGAIAYYMLVKGIGLKE